MTTLNDGVVADGLISLREAINTANNDGGNSAIPFAVNGTITLNGTVLPSLVSNGALSITGPAAGVTISGDSLSRIFNNNSAVSVTLAKLTLINGKESIASGGAIASGTGPLMILNCTFTGNSANDSGGAIYSAGTPTVNGCTFSGNSADYGGAIYTNTASVVSAGPDPVQTASIQNGTFTGNSANIRGGAIYNENGLTRIESCTITGNSALANQGAGVATFGDGSTLTRLSNSIVADNRTTGGADSGSDVDFVGSNNSVASQGHNAIGDGNGAVSFIGAGDQTNVTSAQIKLGALANNGGPTQTMALLAGSVAIDISVDVPITGTDPNGGTVTFKRVGGPKNGTGGLITLGDGTTVMRYILRANFVGVEVIKFVAFNSDGRPSPVATITITVSASPPSAITYGGKSSGGNS